MRMDTEETSFCSSNNCVDITFRDQSLPSYKHYILWQQQTKQQDEDNNKKQRYCMFYTSV